jgi:hypothetical protein
LKNRVTISIKLEDAVAVYILFGIILVGLIIYIAVSISGINKSKTEIDNLLN